jgi:PAS domain S-box-containing protein
MKIIKNAFWLSGARGVADVASFALFAAISRAFGPAGTGEYSYAFAIGNLVALIGSSGLEEYGIREYAVAARAAQRKLWCNILSSQARQLIVAAIFLGLFLLSGINHSARSSVIIESTVFFVGWYTARTFFIPAMARQSMRLPAVTDLSCRLFAILCALGLVFGLRLSLPLALIGFPAAGLVMAGIALANSRRYAGVPRLDAPWMAVRATLRGTMPFAATEILNQFYARADLLLIAIWLSASAVGLYAIGIKFVEVGLLPLILLGTAVYPVIGRLARAQTALLSQATRDFVYLIMLLNGWLAVGIATLLPLLIEPVFGREFHQVIELLWWFALFAVAKGSEVALYRLLFCFRRQSWYAGSLAVGTAVIVTLNILLIPKFGLRGALAAAILSTIVVDIACLYGLRHHVRLSSFASAAARMILALGLTTLVFLATDDLGLDQRMRALLCCLFYPIAGFLSGLIPDWRRGPLFSRLDSSVLEPAVDTLATPSSEPTAATAVDTASPSGMAAPMRFTKNAITGKQRWWTRGFLEFTNDAIIIWEMEGRGIIYWNRAAEQLYGYSREEACGQVTHSLLGTRLGGVTVANQLETALGRYGIWVGELNHTTRDGRQVDVEARLAVMSQESGRWLVLEVNRDVTDRKKAEEGSMAVEMQLAHLRSHTLILR